MTDPRTPLELKQAFINSLGEQQLADPMILQAIDELMEKIELVYCGEYEMTVIERLFGRSLLEGYLQKEEIWND